MFPLSLAKAVPMSSALISSADALRIAIPPEDADVAALGSRVVHKLTYAVGRDPVVATDWDWFMALRPATTTFPRANASITCRWNS